MEYDVFYLGRPITERRLGNVDEGLTLYLLTLTESKPWPSQRQGAQFTMITKQSISAVQ